MATSTDLRAAIEEVQQQLPAEQLEAMGLEADRGGDWAAKVEQRVGALPWWVISAVVHAVIFLLATLLTVAMPPAQIDELVINTDVAKKEEQKYDEKLKRDIFKQENEIKHETKVEKPVLVHEETEVTDHFETENDMDAKTARGQEDAISDIPLGGTGVTGSMGVGGGGMAGCFGYRDGGGRKRAVQRFGGSDATESAVEAALRWLARHQEADGHWDAGKYGSTGYEPHMGDTGLALLAFLGAGHTHRAGRFRDNVERAAKWIVANQKADTGAIFFRSWGRPAGSYGHAIAGLALAEAYGMTRDESLRGPAQRAVDYSLSTMQQPYSGWRYKPKGEDDDYLADLSVTGWYVMQLKSAKIAGLRVDSAGFQGATNFVDKVTTREGHAGYASPGANTPAMTSVGMVCRQFMGTANTSPLLVGGGRHLAANLPRWEDPDAHRDFYYIYYGTLAMFQMGGETWNAWNTNLKPLLVSNQRKGGPMDGSTRDLDGSWDPYGHSGNLGGRVFTTAVGALTLEVYYRYLPMYSK